MNVTKHQRTSLLLSLKSHMVSRAQVESAILDYQGPIWMQLSYVVFSTSRKAASAVIATADMPMHIYSK